MSIAFSGTITGASMTGLTSPTFPLAGETVDGRGKTAYVASLGGTQPGVTAHSVSSPFLFSFITPAQMKTVGVVNALNGRLSKSGNNVYRFRVNKGAPPLAGQPADICSIVTDISVAAGCETASRNEIAALISAYAGWFAVQANRDGLVDTIVSGMK